MPSFSGTQLTCLRGDRLVFSHLSFSLDSGEALILTGRNGSGKTSLLRLMAGLARPWQGDLRFNGQAIAEDMELHRQRLRYVGHAEAIKPVLTASENLAVWAHLADAGRSDAGRLGAVDPAARAHAALDWFGIGHLADVPCQVLSAGQRRRVGLARLLVTPAPLWLLDEPTTALDRTAVGLLNQVIADHRARGGLVVLSTHADWPIPNGIALSLDDFAGLGPIVVDGDDDEAGANDAPGEVGTDHDGAGGAPPQAQARVDPEHRP